MGQKSKQENFSGDINQKKNISYWPTHPISQESNEKPPNNKKLDITIYPEIEAEFVLGNFIDQILNRHNSNNNNHIKNIPDGDIHNLETEEFANNSAKYEISDSCVELFLEKKILDLEEKYSDIADEEIPATESSTAAKAENSLLDEKNVSGPEKEPGVENFNEHGLAADNYSSSKEIMPTTVSSTVANIENSLIDAKNVSKPDKEQGVEKFHEQQLASDQVESSNEKIPVDESSTDSNIQKLEEKTDLRIKETSEKNLNQEEDFDAAAEDKDVDHAVILQNRKEIADKLLDNEVSAIFQATMNFEEESDENIQETNTSGKVDIADSSAINALIDNDEISKNSALIKDDQIKPDESVSDKSKVNGVKNKSEIDMGDEKLNHLCTGIKLYKEKNYEDAIIEFKKALKIDPDYKIAYRLLANSFFRNSMFIEALEPYEHLKNKSPIDLIIHENLGIIYSKLGMHQLAVKEWKALLKLHPEKTDIQKKLDETLNHLNGNAEHSNIKPTDEKLKLIISGIEFYKNKDFDAAIQVFRGAINRYPDEKDAYNFLANVYFRNKMLKEALVTYEALKKKDKGNITAYENMGLIYAKQGEYSKALFEWKKVLEENPERQDIKKKISKVQQTLSCETL